MLTKRYMATVKNLPAVFQKIRDGTAPDKFSVDHLKKLGFTSSNDRAVIPLLKDLKLLNEDGSPAPRYHTYRDKSRSKAVLGEALREAYADVFHLTEKPTKTDKEAIEGLFKSTHNASDVVAERQAMTFLALLDLADVGVAAPSKKDVKEEPPVKPQMDLPLETLGLRYNIEIHLPATKDIEVYNAIFRSLKENLL